MHVRKISSVLKKVLTPENLISLIRVAKNDPLYEPKASVNQSNIILKYTEQMRKAYEQDTQRIDVEVQDEHIQKETAELFNGEPLDSLNGYNIENSNIFFRRKKI